MPLQPGQMLNNRYRIVRLLGQGGFGAVYRAWDANLSRPCALKENLDTSPEAQRQFAREATVLANLSHPNMPRVTDHFSLPDQGQYLVMDFVEGEDLATHLDEHGAIPVEEALEWISQVADALAYLHRRQPPVVHRDIKPANIRVTPEGKAMLVDFGLVKMYDPNMKTTMGARAVTPGYAPPEQYGQGSTDTRTDIYALGATLYTLLTNLLPMESIQRMVGKKMPSVQQINPQIPAYIGQVIERAMDIEPDCRFQSAADFKAALKSNSAGQQTVQPYVPSATLVMTPPQAAEARSMQAASAGLPLEQFPADFAPAKAGTGPRPSSARKAQPQSKPAAAQSKTRSPGLWISIIVVSVLCLAAAIGGGYYLGVYQPSAQETQDAKDQATLDARVRLTSTAQAEATAISRAGAASTGEAVGGGGSQDAAKQTEQASEKYAADLIAVRSQVFGPKSGNLAHNQEDSLISVDAANANLNNFIVEVTFSNPYAAFQGAWDYGIVFRAAAKNEELRLVIRSDKSWEVTNLAGAASGNRLATGSVSDLNTDEGGWNFIQLICQGNRGLLFINRVFIAEVDLSARTNAGDIRVATGMYAGDEINGKQTGFQDFTVWSIP